MTMPAAAPARHPGLRRGWAEVGLVVTGALLLVAAAVPVEADRVDDVEAAVFRAVNGTAFLPFVVVWPFMQLGNLLVVPVVAAVAAALRRWRLAAAALLAGAGVYVLAKVAKGIVERGRPDGLLEDVVIRGAAAHGRGYVSGHAAVAVALVVVAWPWLGTRGRIVCAALAVTVCFARVHVGSHLPLDVVGGAGLGMAVGGLVLLLVGRPARLPAPLRNT
jgi:membrane-associated phospholipid phosphatase